jgi:NADH-quinone oxidoreductase subunit N
MNTADLINLLPFIILAATSVVIVLVIAFLRSHRLTAFLTLAGIGLAIGSLVESGPLPAQTVTPLAVVDPYAFFFLGLILAASFAVACLSYPYLEMREGKPEEFYVLLLIAALGAAILTVSAHFATFFLGIETLTVSLYAMIAYLRKSGRSLEAGVKYLILAAVSSAFILFGMALVYGEAGSMEFAKIAAMSVRPEGRSLLLTTGFALIVVGVGFKLAVVPFHMWTPDVYEGAPAPVTAFVATVSKGAVFAVVLRYFGGIGIPDGSVLFAVFAVVAAASMFTGNLLALLQQNVKRILAYSSISHLGYLLVAFLAGGPMGAAAAAFYLAAYFVTTLGAFGVVGVLSPKDRDADGPDDYLGLAWRRPWIAAVLTAMLISLAGIPLTAGFVGKFYLVAAGIGSSLWLLVAVLIVNSAVGLYYYLRIVTALFSRPGHVIPAAPATTLLGGGALAILMALLFWLGVYPGPVIDIIKKTVQY